MLSLCKISLDNVYFTLPGDSLAVPDNLTAAAMGIKEAWMGFAEEETLRDIMKVDQGAVDCFPFPSLRVW